MVVWLCVVVLCVVVCLCVVCVVDWMANLMALSVVLANCGDCFCILFMFLMILMVAGESMALFWRCLANFGEILLWFINPVPPAPVCKGRI